MPKPREARWRKPRECQGCGQKSVYEPPQLCSSCRAKLDMSGKAIEAASKSEKKAIEKVRPCCNKPPLEPYDVETEVPLVGISPVKPFLFGKDHVYHMELSMDVHVERACKLELEMLEGIFTAPDLMRPPHARKLLEFPTDFFHENIPGPPGKLMHIPDDFWQEKEYRLNVILNYPLDISYCFHIPITITRAGFYAGHMVWAVCQAYRLAYLDPKKYGIWGHALSDLYIERILIDIKNHILRPMMGS